MNFKYFPHTEEEIKQMLAKAGMESLDDLYSDVPEQIRFKGEYDLPEPLSEAGIRTFFEKIGNKTSVSQYLPEQDATTITLRL